MIRKPATVRPERGYSAKKYDACSFAAQNLCDGKAPVVQMSKITDSTKVGTDLSPSLCQCLGSTPYLGGRAAKDYDWTMKTLEVESFTMQIEIGLRA